MRPILRCWVSLPVDAAGEGRFFLKPVLVPLDRAHELKELGFMVLGPDPFDEIDLATFEREQRAPFDADEYCV